MHRPRSPQITCFCPHETTSCPQETTSETTSGWGACGGPAALLRLGVGLIAAGWYLRETRLAGLTLFEPKAPLSRLFQRIPPTGDFRPAPEEGIEAYLARLQREIDGAVTRANLEAELRSLAEGGQGDGVQARILRQKLEELASSQVGQGEPSNASNGGVTPRVAITNSAADGDPAAAAASDTGVVSDVEDSGLPKRIADIPPDRFGAMFDQYTDYLLGLYAKMSGGDRALLADQRPDVMVKLLRYALPGGNTTNEQREGKTTNEERIATGLFAPWLDWIMETKSAGPILSALIEIMNRDDSAALARLLIEKAYTDREYYNQISDALSLTPPTSAAARSVQKAVSLNEWTRTILFYRRPAPGSGGCCDCYDD